MLLYAIVFMIFKPRKTIKKNCRFVQNYQFVFLFQADYIGKQVWMF